jgi:hypothetical protein
VSAATSTDGAGPELPNDEYLPDRYDRLNKCAAIYADGITFAEDSFFTKEMIPALAESLTQARVLDGLTEHDADTIGLLTILDFPGGLHHMAWRITDWLSDNRTLDRTDDNEFAVVSVLARVLAITAGAFVGEEFEKAQRQFPDDADLIGGAK